MNSFSVMWGALKSSWVNKSAAKQMIKYHVQYAQGNNTVPPSKSNIIDEVDCTFLQSPQNRLKP